MELWFTCELNISKASELTLKHGGELYGSGPQHTFPVSETHSRAIGAFLGVILDPLQSNVYSF